MIRAAIVGLGRWGRNMVTAVQGRSKRFGFSHCVVRRPEAAREFAAQHGLKVVTALDTVLADPEVQAVVLTTPHSLHVEQVVATAAAGKPVFCEKPLALDRAGAARAIDACAKASVPLGLGHDKRFFPSMQHLKRLVDAGALGAVLHVEGHFSNETTRKFYAGWRESPAESPGGGLTATGVHILDAFIHLVGPVRSVYARLLEWPPAPDPVDALSVLLESDSGVSGVLCGVRSTPQFWRLHVFGKDASAEALGDRQLVLRRSDTQPEYFEFEPLDTLRYELEAFADAIEGRSPYPISIEQIRADCGAIEAIIESLALKTPVLVGKP